MTNAERIAARERCEKATPGPWEWWAGNPWHANAPNHPLREERDNPPQVFSTGNPSSGFFYKAGAQVQARQDTCFIAAARADLPAALDALDAADVLANSLREERDEKERLLLAAEKRIEELTRTQEPLRDERLREIERSLMDGAAPELMREIRRLQAEVKTLTDAFDSQHEALLDEQELHERSRQGGISLERQRNDLRAQLQAAWQNVPSTAEFTSRLRDRLCDIIQGEMCEWGTIKKLADESGNSLRILMNNMARTVLTRIDALLDSFIGKRIETKDEFGRRMVWVAAEIGVESVDEQFWDEHDRVVLAEIKALKQKLQTATAALEAAREDGAEWERLANMCNRQIREMDTRLERELRFHEELAAECEVAGTDFARGRACGIKELAEDIKKAIPPPPAAEPQAEHPDTARLNWLESECVSDRVGNGIAIFPTTTRLTGELGYTLVDLGDEDVGEDITDRLPTLRTAIDAARSAGEKEKA